MDSLHFHDHRAESGWRDALLGIALAVFASLIINLPLWRAIATTNEWRWNDVVPESSDELFYLTRIREVADGYPHIGNPVLFERRNQAYPQGNLWENILSLPLTQFGWRMKTLAIASDALLPFLLALCTWFASRSIVRDPQWRALALGLIFLGTNVALWKRPISPQATTILPLLWLWLLLDRRRASMPRIAARSMLIGLMVYSYPYHWTYCAATEAILWLDARLREKTITRSALLHVAALSLPFALIALPWIHATWIAAADPAYGETLSRLGLIERRLPVGPVLHLKLLLTGGFLLVAMRRHTIDGARVLLALLCGGILVLWLPLLTGREAEFTNHYEKFLVVPIVLSFIVALAALTTRKKYLALSAMILVALAIMLSTVTSAREEFAVFRSARRPDAERQALADTLAILTALPRESVILTENAYVPTLTTYTTHYPFTFYEAYMYLAPDAEIVERARVYNALVPSDRLRPRGIFGTRYENRTLYREALCRLAHLVTEPSKDCRGALKNDCTECAAFDALPALTNREILDVLRESHVGYVLLKNTPSLLAPYLQRMAETPDGRTLYELRLPR